MNTNSAGDRFVGLKADTNNATVCFPIGYQLPLRDDELRADIHNLFYVLSDFMKESGLEEDASLDAPRTVRFPIHAYLQIIRDYLRTGRYFIETESEYKTAARGNVSWPRTVREQRALVQKNGSLIFTNMTVRSVTPNADKKITQIHRYCVYEAFEKLGWLYVPYMPEKPGPHPGSQEAVSLLERKLASTHNDLEQALFSSMRAMLLYMDERTSEKRYFFGTDFFERVWEGMIDRAFGIPDKEKYFPKTRWHMDYGESKVKTPLMPDSIMLYNGKVYILDAKLYRYGCSDSDNPSLLPNSADINKQITYGEYIERFKGVPEERLYNAFIMPFNSSKNLFTRLDENGSPVPAIPDYVGNVGEATGDWKPNPKKYERIQGIVMDTRFLMYHYAGMPERRKGQLAEAIEKVDFRGPIAQITT